MMTREMAAAFLMVLTACSPTAHDAAESKVGRPAAPPADVARARQASQALAKDLAERLFAELEASGPLAAITVCSQVAQETARAHSVDGLEVRRVSLRVRNPADEPDPWERVQLTELEERLAAGELPDEVIAVEQTATGHELRYLKPIRIAPPCLTCHGSRESMSVELVGHLAELYPEDQATGYELGDLRGAVSVQVPIPAEEVSGG